MWALQELGTDGYDGLVILEAGDKLKIYNKSGDCVFCGTVTPCTEFSRNTEKMGRPYISNIWVHWAQEGVDPELWLDFFMSGNYSGVVKRKV